MVEEQGESFHQDKKQWRKDTRDTGIPTRCQTIAGAEKGRLLAVASPEKYRKGNFKINNHALLSLMKKEYVIIFGQFLAF